MQKRTGSLGAQEGSTKQPDFSVTAGFNRLPTLVFESGWSKSLPLLRLDKDLWILTDVAKFQLLCRGREKGGGGGWGIIKCFKLGIDGFYVYLCKNLKFMRRGIGKYMYVQ